MKQSKQLPRRVGTSMVRSLHKLAQQLNETYAKRGDAWSGGFPQEYASHNKSLFTAEDIIHINMVCKFQNDLDEQRSQKVDSPKGSFITLVAHPTPTMKYMVNDTALGLVITTTLLKRLLELATTSIRDVEHHSAKARDFSPVYTIEYCKGYRSNNFNENEPNFLRLVDLIRYMDEVDVQMLEIQVEGYQHDYELMDDASNSGNYYSRHGSNTRSALCKMLLQYPMLSDRFQEDSWGHYLRTQYKHMVTINSSIPCLSKIGKDVCVAELNLLG
tara:strand:+ start:831 stop:1649 length:819 start_codon:yes stop_codon:yes gene_type:complete